jgi:hypothetical protein
LFRKQVKKNAAFEIFDLTFLIQQLKNLDAFWQILVQCAKLCQAIALGIESL